MGNHHTSEALEVKPPIAASLSGSARSSFKNKSFMKMGRKRRSINADNSFTKYISTDDESGS